MTKSDWISVESALPNDGGRKFGIPVLAVILNTSPEENETTWRRIMLVSSKGGNFYHGYVGGHKIGSELYQTVTHWMYLPDLPKKQKSKKTT